MRRFSLGLVLTLVACSGARNETIRSIDSVAKDDAGEEPEADAAEPEPEPEETPDPIAPDLDADAGEDHDAGADRVGDAPDASDASISDASVCVPSGPETCNRLDDDCNGIVDDVDVASDGITDCLRILLIGSPGLQPSSDFQKWLTGQGTSVMRANTAAAEMLTAQLLASYDIVILDLLVRSYTENEAVVLRDWVEQGGALMSLNGHTGSSDATFGNSLLAPFGIQHAPGLRSGPVTSFEMHPLTTGLASVTFSGGYGLSLDGAPPNTVVIATLPPAAGTTGQALPVAYAQERGKGRVYVWGDEWVTFDSQWRSMPMIQRFWIDALGWLAHQR